MGIDVINKCVSFNDSHEELVNTSTLKNPTFTNHNGLKIFSIYKRVKSRQRNDDGNPLIYALKEINSFSISKRECIKFLPSFNAILDKYLQGKSYDFIIPMPSTHLISYRLAERVARETTNSCPILINLFAKKTVGEVCLEFKSIDIPAKFHIRRLSLIKGLESANTPDKLISMKDIDVKLRPYISPFKLIENLDLNNKNVLIVDDLLATGTSLKCIEQLLLNDNNKISVDALCLLSSLK